MCAYVAMGFKELYLERDPKFVQWFGLDFILDDKFDPYLLEINSDP